jgi:hypothetical protein
LRLVEQVGSGEGEYELMVANRKSGRVRVSIHLVGVVRILCLNETCGHCKIGIDKREGAIAGSGALELVFEKHRSSILNSEVQL